MAVTKRRRSRRTRPMTPGETYRTRRRGRARQHEESEHGTDATLHGELDAIAECYSSYVPIEVDPGAAQRGIRARLGGAMCSGALTVMCAWLIVAWQGDKFAMAALGAIGFGALLATISMSLSARREEIVHQLAHDLHRQPRGLLPVEPGFPPPNTTSRPQRALHHTPGATDGTI